MRIDGQEVLRYLGYKGQKMDESTRRLLDDTIAGIEEWIDPGYTYGIFDLDRGDNGPVFVGTGIRVEGHDLKELLADAPCCALMAVTLGPRIDGQIALLAKTDLAASLVMDACASVAVEALCRQLEEEIKAIARSGGLSITRRFSPGYGDLPIYVQQDWLNVLDAYRRIGLSVSDAMILLPRKSLTAIVGFQKGNGGKGKKPGCPGCSVFGTCNYRKEGKYCGY